jgi:hypothetical protein
MALTVPVFDVSWLGYFACPGRVRLSQADAAPEFRYSARVITLEVMFSVRCLIRHLPFQKTARSV